ILAEWSFCNVYRERDRVTCWIRDRWRDPHRDDPDLWFAMAVARLVNWPETLSALGWPVPWRPEHFLQVMGRGGKVYGDAYMIGTAGQRGSKPEYQAARIFNPLWHARERLRPRPGETLNSYHARLAECPGLSSFMAAQVVADLKYAIPLRDAA